MSAAARLLTEITPPIVLRSVRSLWRRMRGLKPYDFYGAWPTLADVPISQGDDPWAETLAPAQLDNLKSTPTVDRNGHLILPLLASQHAGTLTVLDFGGSRGVGLANILRHTQLKPPRLSYVLVETPAMCEAIRGEIEPRYGQVMSEIPPTLPAPLIVHAGGSVQYLLDYEHTLAELARLKPAIFIVAQTPMTDVPTYARQIFSVPGRVMRTWVFNRADFVAQMSAFSYRLVFSVDHDLPLTHKNAPAPSVMSSMVFVPR